MRLIALLATAALVAADTVVLRDGTILEGSVTKGATALAVGGEPAPLADVLLWEGDALLPLNAPSFEAHALACAALADRQLLAESRKRFPELLAAGAADAARLTLMRAALAGLPAPEAADWDKRLASCDNKGASGAAPGNEILAGILVARARALLKAGEEHHYRGSQLLREALVADPKRPEALELLKEIAPESPTFGQVKDDPDRARRIWLDWHVDVLRGEVRTLKPRQPDMERAINVWKRKDLNGIETREEGAEIVFITPIDDKTELIGRCVAHAKITCRALAKMFLTDAPRRDDNEPLRIYFYESQKEYVNFAGRPNPFLAKTGGFYTSAENVSRFYLPERPNASRDVRDVFIHELTHHWIERRNPRWHARDFVEGVRRQDIGGFWIVEGFATFMEEGRYDIDAFTWSHFNPHADSLDVVAALSRDGGLIDWEKVYALSQNGFFGPGLAKEGTFATAARRWGITPHNLVEIRLFYEQSAATCHCLYWVDGGKHREQLLDFVTAHYTGQGGKMDIAKAFGMTPKQLGALVEGFAKKVADGWRP
ncbi:MAG: hypothetical protein ACHQ1G_12275, partial [Planctomycetota bacterium]